MIHTVLADAINLQTDFTLQPGGKAVATSYGTFASLFSILLPNIMLLAGIILFLLLIFGGFSIISSSGNPKGTEQGQKAITGAIIGFFIIFAAYWIIQILQLITGITILNTG